MRWPAGLPQPEIGKAGEVSYPGGITGSRTGIGLHRRAGRVVKAGGFTYAHVARARPRFVHWSAPEPQRACRPLIAAMHGWSYDERHLFAFAHLFPAETVMASVRGPYPEAGGHAWFPSRGNPKPRVANDAAEAVLDWLDTVPRPHRPIFSDSPKVARWCCICCTALPCVLSRRTTSGVRRRRLPARRSGSGPAAAASFWAVTTCGTSASSSRAKADRTFTWNDYGRSPAWWRYTER